MSTYEKPKDRALAKDADTRPTVRIYALAYPQKLSPADINQIGKYLGDKYSITWSNLT